ncbi:MAG: hypothetical protein MK135_04380 [Polyangiaceae bacterium]|nr:hypothetical protein [Polyangiaceae bacterium]
MKLIRKTWILEKTILGLVLAISGCGGGTGSGGSGGGGTGGDNGNETGGSGGEGTGGASGGSGGHGQEGPVATITLPTAPPTIAQGEQVGFEGTCSEGSSGVWSFGEVADDIVLDDSVAIVPFPNLGAYEVELTCSDSDNRDASASMTVTVNGENVTVETPSVFTGVNPVQFVINGKRQYFLDIDANQIVIVEESAVMKRVDILSNFAANAASSLAVDTAGGRLLLANADAGFAQMVLTWDLEGENPGLIKVAHAAAQSFDASALALDSSGELNFFSPSSESVIPIDEPQGIMGAGTDLSTACSAAASLAALPSDDWFMLCQGDVVRLNPSGAAVTYSPPADVGQALSMQFDLGADDTFGTSDDRYTFLEVDGSPAVAPDNLPDVNLHTVEPGADGLLGGGDDITSTETLPGSLLGSSGGKLLAIVRETTTGELLAWDGDHILRLDAELKPTAELFATAGVTGDNIVGMTYDDLSSKLWFLTETDHALRTDLSGTVEVDYDIDDRHDISDFSGITMNDEGHLIIVEDKTKDETSIIEIGPGVDAAWDTDDDFYRLVDVPATAGAKDIDWDASSRRYIISLGAGQMLRFLTEDFRPGGYVRTDAVGLRIVSYALVDSNTAWALDDRGAITKVNVRGRIVGAPLELGVSTSSNFEAAGMAFGDGKIWFADSGGEAVYRFSSDGLYEAYEQTLTPWALDSLDGVGWDEAKKEVIAIDSFAMASFDASLNLTSLERREVDIDTEYFAFGSEDGHWYFNSSSVERLESDGSRTELFVHDGDGTTKSNCSDTHFSVLPDGGFVFLCAAGFVQTDEIGAIVGTLDTIDVDDAYLLATDEDGNVRAFDDAGTTTSEQDKLDLAVHRIQRFPLGEDGIIGTADDGTKDMITLELPQLSGTDSGGDFFDALAYVPSSNLIAANNEDEDFLLLYEADFSDVSVPFGDSPYVSAEAYAWNTNTSTLIYRDGDTISEISLAGVDGSMTLNLSDLGVDTWDVRGMSWDDGTETLYVAFETTNGAIGIYQPGGDATWGTADDLNYVVGLTALRTTDGIHYDVGKDRFILASQAYNSLSFVSPDFFLEDFFVLEGTGIVQPESLSMDTTTGELLLSESEQERLFKVTLD